MIVRNGSIIHRHAEYLGIHTNNYAEYRGLIAAISHVVELGEESAEFVMDSELVIRQMRGEYRVKSPDMKTLHDDAKALSSLIPRVSFRNVRRSEEFIPVADRLLNEEMDRHRSRTTVWNGAMPLQTILHFDPMIRPASSEMATSVCSPVVISRSITEPDSNSRDPMMTAKEALAEEANFIAFAIFLHIIS